VTEPSDEGGQLHCDHITRYRLDLAMPERDSALGDRRAIALLQSEFALALNASYFMALSADDIDVAVVARMPAQAGLTRYAVELELAERAPEMSDAQAGDLVRREFRRALNASHFLRICLDDVSVTLVARERVDTIALRAA
jgi:hypothetical protein